MGFINGFICKQITLTTEDRIYTYLKNEIHLSDLVNCLGNTHVSLNLDFLKELLRNASGTEHPAIDRSFAGCSVPEAFRMKMIRIIII